MDDVFLQNNFVYRIYSIELEINGYHRYRYVCFIPWHTCTPRNWQWGAVKNETSRQKRLFKFSLFPFICSIILAAPAYGVHISQLIRYSRACGSFQDFLYRGFVAANKEATESSCLSLSYHFERLRSPPWLGWSLWNICVTNDHGYIPFVVNTSRSLPRS
jgi:hypothetical protein